jgi:hypothetical protein
MWTNLKEHSIQNNLMVIQLAKKQKPILGACRAKGIESDIKWLSEGRF